MKIQRNVTGYELSTDYAKLAKLARTQSVVCLAPYSGCIDVAQTLFDWRDGVETFQIASRGMGYVYSEGEEEFKAHCAGARIQFIPPTKP